MARVSKGASTISGSADDTEAAVKGKDFGAVASFAAQIGDRALADSTSLKANQPSACYKAAHQSATEAYGEIKLAADSIVAASKTADVPTIDAQLVMIRDEIAVLESSAAAAGNC